ncbi:MAG: deoxyribonuclease IV [Oscillospiraceae bacterium]|jgi:deoxyribonuclease-4|nr:deoxyribonuclease IV [Oscillospiraceae bacterium]
MFLIGCHLSSSGGFLAMGKTAASLGANVFQFFTRNPRGGSAKIWPDADIAAYAAFAAENGITAPLGHAPYTLNAAAEKPNIRQFARETMAEDLAKLERIPNALFNFHPGSHVGQGVERGIELIVECLNAAVDPDGAVPVLLETMAAKGSEIGGNFAELRAIIDGVDEKIRHRLGVTLDTCHVYDAGYNIVGDLDGVLAEFDRTIGLSRLKAVHLNDSKYPFASHHDRHEVIGGGSLGTDAIAAVINHKSLRDLPFYLETPNEPEGYAKEIEILRNLR